MDLWRDGVLRQSSDAVSNAPDHLRSTVSSRQIQSMVTEELSVLPAAQLRAVRKVSGGAFIEVKGINHISAHPGHFDRGSMEGFVLTEAVFDSPGVVLEEFTHMADRILGFVPGDKTSTVSGGQGILETLRSAGRELRSIYDDDPDAVGAYGASNPREFLAHAVRLYSSSEDVREDLRQRAPRLYTFLRETWFNERFWEQVESQL